MIPDPIKVGQSLISRGGLEKVLGEQIAYQPVLWLQENHDGLYFSSCFLPVEMIEGSKVGAGDGLQSFKSVV
jgi:hypothetical protein